MNLPWCIHVYENLKVVLTPSDGSGMVSHHVSVDVQGTWLTRHHHDAVGPCYGGSFSADPFGRYPIPSGTPERLKQESSFLKQDSLPSTEDSKGN